MFLCFGSNKQQTPTPGYLAENTCTSKRIKASWIIRCASLSSIRSTFTVQSFSWECNTLCLDTVDGKTCRVNIGRVIFTKFKVDGKTCRAVRLERGTSGSVIGRYSLIQSITVHN